MLPAPNTQCAANLDALLFGHYRFPRLTPLVTRTDRVFYSYQRAFEDAVVASGAFTRWNRFLDGHRDPDPITTADHGYRETAPFASCQLVIHLCRPGNSNLVYGVVEADIDLCNPDGGLVPATLHLGEVLAHRLTGGRTDPFRAARWLRRRNILIPEVRT